MVVIFGMKNALIPDWDESVRFVVPPKFSPQRALGTPVTGSAPWMFPSPLGSCLPSVCRSALTAIRRASLKAVVQSYSCSVITVISEILF